MRLSTSSSNDRLPQVAWQRVWLIAGLLFVLLIGGWELFWRAKGFQPSLNDDAALWALSRKKISNGGENSVVFIGASRIQLDLNTDVFASQTGARPIVLAIDGESPTPVLRDLANDEAFHGTIICELAEHLLFFVSEREGLEKSVASQWLQEYQERTFSSDFERELENIFEKAFVFRLSDLTFRNVIGNIRLGRLPLLPYQKIKPDRSRDADYTKLDIQEHRRKREELVQKGYEGDFPLQTFLAGAQEIEQFVSRIQARGGKVVFVRFPTSGRHWDLDEAKLPKAQYWNTFASCTTARTVHFKDYPSLSVYNCPDGSHLDYRDAIPFTKALVEILYSERAER